MRLPVRLEIALQGEDADAFHLPAPRLQQLGLVESCEMSSPGMPIAQLLARFEQLHRVVVVRRRLHDRLGARSPGRKT